MTEQNSRIKSAPFTERDLLSKMDAEVRPQVKIMGSKVNRDLRKEDDFEAEMIDHNVITFKNALMYRGYRIYHSDSPWPGKFQWVHDSYDGPGDNRLGSADTIEKCVIEINDYIHEND